MQVSVISDEKFKEQMLYLMKTAVLKVGENSKEIAFLRKEIDKNSKELKGLKKEFRANAGLDNDVRFRNLEMINRLFEIENQIDSLADSLPELKEEHIRIFTETLNLAHDIDDNPDAKIQLDELNIWLENLEEKLFEY